MISKKPADVIFQDCIDDPIERHDRAEPDQQFSAGKRPCQHIHSAFCGKCCHKDAAGNRSFRVCIRKPGVERRHGRIQQESKKYEFGSKRSKIKNLKCYRSGGCRVHDNPAQQDTPSEEMHKDIPKSRLQGPIRSSKPDQKDRGNRHDLPEDEEREQIAGKDYAKSASHIEKRSHVLCIVLYVERIDHPNKRHDYKDIGKNHAELVYPAQDKLKIQELVCPIGAVGHIHQIHESNGRNQQHKRLFEYSYSDQRDQKRSDNINKCGRHDINHNNPLFS